MSDCKHGVPLHQTCLACMEALPKPTGSRPGQHYSPAVTFAALECSQCGQNECVQILPWQILPGQMRGLSVLCLKCEHFCTVDLKDGKTLTLPGAADDE